jgi:hypothetical protein
VAQLYDANGNPVFTDVVQQAQALAALNAQNQIQLRGQATVTVQVTAIGTQTLIFEASTDGSNFYTVQMFPLGVAFGGAPVTTTTATGQWIGVVAGMYQFRVRCSVFTSGSATVSIVASQGTNEQQVNVGSAIASTTAGQLGPLVQGAVTTAAPTYTTAQTDPLSLTTAGGLRTDQSSQAGTAVTTVPVAFGTGAPSGNAPGVNSATFIGATAAVASSAGVQKVGIAGGTAGAAIDGAIGAAPPANALQIGAKAATANPANATAGNQVALMADKAGRLVMTLGQVRELVGVVSNAAIVNTTETTIIPAGGAGVFNDLVALIISNNSATAPTTVTIKDATAGTTRLVVNIAAQDNQDIQFNYPIPQAVANNNWTATCAVTGSSTVITCVFLKNT